MAGAVSVARVLTEPADKERVLDSVRNHLLHGRLIFFAEEDISDVRIMGYDAFDTAVFPDVSGLQTWAGHDLTVRAHPTLGKIYIRGQKWMGNSYDALFDPGRSTKLWRNGHKLTDVPQDETRPLANPAASGRALPERERRN